MLDEFPALGRLDFFESALAYMAGYGLRAFLIAHAHLAALAAAAEFARSRRRINQTIETRNKDDRTSWVIRLTPRNLKESQTPPG